MSCRLPAAQRSPRMTRPMVCTPSPHGGYSCVTRVDVRRNCRALVFSALSKFQLIYVFHWKLTNPCLRPPRPASRGPFCCSRGRRSLRATQSGTFRHQDSRARDLFFYSSVCPFHLYFLDVVLGKRRRPGRRASNLLSSAVLTVLGAYPCVGALVVGLAAPQSPQTAT
jgi:hypothetical protein